MPRDTPAMTSTNKHPNQAGAAIYTLRRHLAAALLTLSPTATLAGALPNPAQLGAASAAALTAATCAYLALRLAAAEIRNRRAPRHDEQPGHDDDGQDQEPEAYRWEDDQPWDGCEFAGRLKPGDAVLNDMWQHPSDPEVINVTHVEPGEDGMVTIHDVTGYSLRSNAVGRFQLMTPELADLFRFVVIAEQDRHLAAPPSRSISPPSRGSSLGSCRASHRGSRRGSRLGRTPVSW